MPMMKVKPRISFSETYIITYVFTMPKNQNSYKYYLKDFISIIYNYYNSTCVQKRFIIIHPANCKQD